MSTAPAPAHSRRTYLWWVVLCLVGLDYFSSLAYLPSLAVNLLGGKGDLAPIAGLGVVLVTLLAALPVYWYVIGRSPHGQGGVGLLEKCLHGWTGKLIILVLLGFVATDFVITRSLSTSDAGKHITQNEVYKDATSKVKQEPEKLREALPEALRGRFFDFWDEQLLLTVGLTILTFALYFFLVTTLGRGFVSVAVGVVGLYLLVNLMVIGSGLYYLLGTGDGLALVRDWEMSLRPELGDIRTETGGPILTTLKLALLTFPAMAIGLSGFELSMASAPMVRGSSTDAPARPRGRIFRTRLLMLVAALAMCVLVVSSIFVVTLLVYQEKLDEAGKPVLDPTTGKVALDPDTGLPRREIPKTAMDRSLSHLAHGGRIVNDIPAGNVVPFSGKVFGFVYDLSTVLILCLAGASAAISMKDLVPEFLSRFGMQLAWAHKIGVIVHLFNLVILVVTVAFQASVGAQQWAYAASVLALLFGASLAATLDVRQRLAHSVWRWPASLPFLIITALFVLMGFLIVYQNPAGVAIALLFVAVVLVTAIISRYLRATELRFDGFEFEDEKSRERWEEIRKLEFQVLVPHDPHGSTLRRKEHEIRQRHRLGDRVPIIFVEVTVGDPSDFHQKPLMRIDRQGDEDVIRVSRCTSIAHVLAAVALEFREVGEPPELHFAWSEGSALANNIRFVLLGQGNVPLMVHELIKKAEENVARRPRVLVG